MERLFEPISINSLTLKNRILMPCLDPGFAGEGGVVNSILTEYFTKRAKGGVAFIMVGPAVFDPVGVGGKSEYRIYRDEILEGLSTLVGAIHFCGVPAGLQLHHAGRQANPHLISANAVAPSAIPCPVRKFTPKALEIPEIERIVLKYGEFARKAKQVGFDAVEVHGSHGYLIAEFLSSYSNVRKDRYGGRLENRARFASQVVKEVRKNVGTDFPVFFRIPGEEHVPGGLNKRETSLIAGLMEKAGADAIDVSAGNYQTAEWIVPPMILPRGCNVDAAEAIKQEVSIPVIVAGRINRPELAEEILRQGKADVIAMARGLVADPDLPRKTREGKLNEIRRCVACNVCIDRVFQDGALVCTVNPEAGRESEFEPRPAIQRKKVMIVGGGPGGMEAARVAGLRGHEVTLYEQHDRLGGRIVAAFQTSIKGELKGILDYYEAVLKPLGVNIKLQTTVDKDMVAELNPDAVVMATGSVPILPDIPGVHLSHVVQAVDVLMARVKVEDRAVIIGGGTVGCEVAIFLAEKGVDVTLLETLPYVAHGIPRLVGKMIKDKMIGLGVEIMTNRKVVQISEKLVVYEEAEAKGASLPAVHVVLAIGSRPSNELAASLGDFPGETYLIGDCLEPRRALEAIFEGAEVGLQL